MSFDEDGAFATLGRAARTFFKNLNRDADARAPGSSAVRPLPRATNVNITNENGIPTNPLTRAADGYGGSDF